MLYYLQRFSPAFATTDKTSGYLQVQYLFAYSIRECPLAIRTADHMWTMLTSLTSWCTETATWEYIGIEPTPPACFNLCASFNLCARHQPDAVASVAHPLPRGGCQRRDIGAGNGGRTRVFNLEG